MFISAVGLCRRSIGFAFVALCLVGYATGVWAQGEAPPLMVGDPYVKVVETLGKPKGVIQVGSRQVLTYPGGTLEIREGKLSRIDPDFMLKMVDRKQQLDFEASQKEKGLTLHEGQWITFDEKKRIDAERLIQWRKTHIGLISYTITAKLYPSVTGYFSGARRNKAYQNERSDTRNQRTPEQSVGYAAGEQSAVVYVPHSYDGTRPYGLCVDLRPGSQGDIMRGYAEIADRHQLIWISPNQAGNEVELYRRIALALDSVATMKQDYKIDGSRVYINGFSGGGVVAFTLLMLYPECFRGAISHARNVRLLNRSAAKNLMWLGHFNYFSVEDLHAVAAMGRKWVFISGSLDPNYPQIVADFPQWSDMGFDVLFIDVPGMKHEEASPENFEKALMWLDGVSPKAISDK